MSVDEKLDALADLLRLEAEEVRARTKALHENHSDKSLEAQGVLLRGAVIESEEAALFGRIRVTLAPNVNRKTQIEEFAVRAGSVVRLRARNDDGELVEGARGIVAYRAPHRLVVVFDEVPDELDEDRVDLLRDDDQQTLLRLSGALDGARRASGRKKELCHLILGEAAPRPTEGVLDHFLDERLNTDQREAVRHGVLSTDIALVHGPPGTGKTRVLVEVVRQCLAREERVLALCASNAAVDNFALGVLEADEKAPIARVGHPARVHPRLEAHTVAALTERHERRKLARSLVEEAVRILQVSKKRSDRSRTGYQERREARAEAGRLFADARKLERQAAEEVLRTAGAVFGTLTGYERDLPSDATFDVLVVDEASQALTPAVLLGILRAGRVVLAGDHRQLPPTVLSPDAEKGGLGRTAFDALMEADAVAPVRHMLTVQHRMHEALMAFPSARFYDGRLEAHPSVAGHTLADLVHGPFALLDPDRPFETLDTAGAGHDERAPEGTESRDNPGEAGLAVRVVKDLVGAGLSPQDIGVITPYSAQVAFLVGELAEEVDAGLEVDSVDGFQGREKEAIVFSAVRSNPEGEVGFLADARRLNVAITRARRKLVVIGDSATLCRDPVWNALFEHAMQNGAYRSCFELEGL